MKIAQYRTEQGIRLAVVVNESLIDLQQAALEADRDPAPFVSALALLESGQDAFQFVREAAQKRGSIPLSKVQLDCPVHSRKIVAIGLNYRDHAIEAGQKIPSAPLCFAKFTSSLSGPFDPIPIPAEDAQVDYEAELGVVIGQKAHRISEDRAMQHVAGYVAFNDVSARKWQFDDGQWTRGKSCDGFSPNGPYLITADEVPDPGQLAIKTFLNGQIMQDSNTNQLIFGVAQLVSYLSHSFTLHPGDLIATGTPHGVGFSRKPPVFLKPGDLVEVEIENIGKISNKVV